MHRLSMFLGMYRQAARVDLTGRSQAEASAGQLTTIGRRRPFNVAGTQLCTVPGGGRRRRGRGTNARNEES